MTLIEWRQATNRRWLMFRVLLSGSLLACADPNTYGTPRTTPEGAFHGSFAIESVAALEGGKNLNVFPTLPTYTLRYGVANRTDVGFRFANLSSLGADIKQNLVRGRWDLALEPGVQWFGGITGDEPAPRFFGHLPILIGVNLSREVSVVASPGVAAATGFGDIASTVSPLGRRNGERGVYARLGFGIDIRFTDGFALHPEITALQETAAPHVMLIMAGIGVVQGALPSYDDID